MVFKLILSRFLLFSKKIIFFAGKRIRIRIRIEDVECGAELSFSGVARPQLDRRNKM